MPEQLDSNIEEVEEVVEQESLVYHKSVLVAEVLEYLAPKPGGIYIDATFGTGGHTRAILESQEDCRVIALDWDKEILDTYGEPMKEEFGDRLTLEWGSFAHLYKVLKKYSLKSIDGVLADFGTSQIQIMQRDGFSVYRDTPLDMRMSRAHYRVTAYELINAAPEEQLRQIFWQLGEERYARQIVEAIVLARKKKTIKTTQQLADIVAGCVPKKTDARGRTKIHAATRVFQALRMYVNKELENIESFLAGAVGCVAPGGRIVCISFHSLEDRIVKLFFQDQAHVGALEIVTKKVVTATGHELAANPSSRSACLRAAQIIKSPREKDAFI